MRQSTPRREAGGLGLGSAATQRTVSGTLLWFHRLTHQGWLTSTPSCSRLAGARTFSRPRTFYLSMASCSEPVHSGGKDPVGKLSLSGEPECLSPAESILEQNQCVKQNVHKK